MMSPPKENTLDLTDSYDSGVILITSWGLSK